MERGSGFRPLPVAAIIDAAAASVCAAAAGLMVGIVVVMALDVLLA